MRPLISYIVASSIGVAAICFALGTYYHAHLGSPNRGTTNISDQEAIRLARGTPEASAFVARYPRPTVTVDRSDGCAVDFWVNPLGAAPITNTDYRRLRIFMNPRTSRPAKSLLVCAGHPIERDLLAHLEMEPCLDKTAHDTARDSISHLARP